jgi:hypothetical protein
MRVSIDLLPSRFRIFSIEITEFCSPATANGPPPHTHRRWFSWGVTDAPFAG